jgi:hypothetical protein
MADGDNELREKVEELLKGASSQEGARNILALLFPKIDQALAAHMHQSVDDSEFRRERRLAVRDSAPAYFRLDPQPATWGRTELASIVDSGSQDALTSARDKIDLAPEGDRPRLRRLFLESLDGAFGPSRPFTTNWLLVLVNESPYFLKPKDDATIDLWLVDNLQRLERIVMKALRDREPNERFEIFMTVIPLALDLSLLCDFVRSRLSDLNPKGATRESDIKYFGSRGEELRLLLLSRVRQLVNEGLFWSQAEPSRILWFWWGSNFEEEVRAFTDAAQQTPDGLRSLLKVPISRVRSSAGDYDRVGREWSMIIDLNALADRARRLLESNASEEDRSAAQHFLVALKKGNERV